MKTMRTWRALLSGSSRCRGSGEAIEILRAYAPSGAGWRDALEALGSTGEPANWAGLRDVALERIRASAPDELLPFPDDEPFASWIREDTVFGTFLETARRRWPFRRPRAEPDPADTAFLLSGSLERPGARAMRLAKRRSRADIQQLVAALEAPDVTMRAVAAVALAAQGDARAFAAARDAVENKDLPRALRVIAARELRELPPDVVLPLARTWRGRPWPRRRAADGILQRHATLDDLPWIRRQVSASPTDSHMHGLCNALEMIARFPAEGPFPEIERAFRTMRYTYGRHFAAEALAATDTSFASRLAFECLYDCESQTRAIGASHVALVEPAARERLAQMVADPTEEPAVREAAAARLRPAP